MNVEEQRKLGVRLAKEAGAEKTVEAIKNTDVCFEDILKTAYEELGAEKFAAILKDNEAEWSNYALKIVPEDDENRAALVEKTSEYFNEVLTPESADFDQVVNPNQSADAKEGGAIGARIVNPVGFWFRYTMLWQNPGDLRTFPASSYPDHSQWKWSNELQIGLVPADIINCEKFALPDAPLEEGATCWWYIHITTAQDVNLQSRFTFTYKRGSGNQYIKAWGAIKNPEFDRD